MQGVVHNSTNWDMAEPGHSCQFLLELYGFFLLHMDRNELSEKGRDGGVGTFIDDKCWQYTVKYSSCIKAQYFSTFFKS